MRVERALMVKTPKAVITAGKLLSINGEWSYYRDVEKSRHAFHKFDAWSIQTSILPVLEQDQVRWIYLYDKESGQMYRISLERFKEKAIKRDFGQGEQFYCSIKYFEVVPGMGRIRKYIPSVELIA